ncbi:MAG: hypothetical protein ACJATN_002960 [Neolewinella sp.]|jgi:hypothetical protein
MALVAVAEPIVAEDLVGAVAEVAPAGSPQEKRVARASRESNLHMRRLFLRGQKYKI